MGHIKPDVTNGHLSSFVHERDIINPFLSAFNVSWAAVHEERGTKLSIYVLEPEQHIAESYGLQQELLLAYSAYNEIQPRALGAVDDLLNKSPYRGRVDRMTYVLVSEDQNAASRVREFMLQSQESRQVIVITAEALRTNRGDAWFVRNSLATQFQGRDLFDFRLPLKTDAYFFGREDLLSQYRDSVRRGENRGLFGLRKTGKTSLLFKLDRFFYEERSGVHLFYCDCKSPSVRMKRWFELIESLMIRIARRFNIADYYHLGAKNAAAEFDKLFRRIPADAKVVCVFDEIEYISPVAKLDPHWHRDYIDFWQTFWTVQSQNRSLSALIAGVNPSVVETDSFGGIQNPLFGIVSPNYLKGFTPPETHQMIKTLGRRMGLMIPLDEVEYLHKRYGGHPLLTRLASSLVNGRLTARNAKRPVTVTLAELQRWEVERDSELVFYCRHIISEMKNFYPEEYAALELLAVGARYEFSRRFSGREHLRHLLNYGLVEMVEGSVPHIVVPVLATFVANERSAVMGEMPGEELLTPLQHAERLRERMSLILRDLRFLEKLISDAQGSSLFGPNSFPEADKLLAVPVAVGEQEFTAFLVQLSRSLIESIGKFGQHSGQANYFDSTVAKEFPDLYAALSRVRLYRNNVAHLSLYTNVNRQLLDALNTDCSRRKPSEIPSFHRFLQNRVLDRLMTGLQIEIAKLD